MTVAQKLTPELKNMLKERDVLDHAEGILTYSLLGSPRLTAVIRASDMAQGLEGESAEIGCASGGTTRLIAALNPDRRHWACDTFEGLLDADENDRGLKNGDFNNLDSKADGVRERCSDLPNVQVMQGYFPQCAPVEMCGAQYALVHLDTDTYKSMCDGFEFFRVRMVSGGVMILDDVIGKGTAGGKKFWTEVQALPDRHWQVVEENNPHVVIRFD